MHAAERVKVRGQFEGTHFFPPTMWVLGIELKS